MWTIALAYDLLDRLLVDWFNELAIDEQAGVDRHSAFVDGGVEDVRVEASHVKVLGGMYVSKLQYGKVVI